MKKTILSFACVICFYKSPAISQSDSSISKIKVYAPSGKTGHKSKSLDDSYLWAVKLDLLSAIFLGNIPVFFEYRLGKKYSLEIGPGLTYGNNIISSLIDELDEGASDYSSKGALGISYKGSFKYYPSKDDDPIEGWNFGVSFQNKNVRRNYDSSYNFTKDELNITNSFNLLIGKQSFTNSNICSEWSLGLGIGLKKLKYYADNVNTGGIDYVTENSIVPSFSLAYKLGFGN